MDSWILAVREVAPLAVAERLGLTVRRRRFVCPTCGATRTRRDSAPPCGVTGDGLGWRCHACDAAGSTLDLVAEATCGSRPATGDRDAWARLRAECADLGLCDPAPGPPPPRRPPPPRPVAPAPPDRPPPPPVEVADLWGRCRPLDTLDAGGPVAAWLDGRELPREDLAAEDLTRELPAGEECPSWATAGRPWSASPRLLLPLFDSTGLVSLWARWAGRGEPPEVKELSPTGCARVGLLADRRGRALLAGTVPEDLAGVLVVEGSTDWLRAAVAVARGDAPPLAVLGGVAGSWRRLPEALSALPPDVPVYAAQDPGKVGDRYAEETRAALPGRPVYRVGLPAEEDLDDRLRAEPGALADDDDGWGLLRVARENGPMADTTTTTPAEEPADLDRWTVAEAVRLLVARAHPERGRPVGFPWPGAPETWPLGGDGTTDIKPDAALPPADGVCRPNWRPLWSLVGPLSPDRVAVLVGPTGRGKTAFAVQVAEAAAAAGHPVVYLSVELGAEELAARLIALRARGAVPWRAVLRGQVPRPELEQAGTDLVTRCPNLYLCAPPPGQRTAARLARLARAVAARHDGRPPLVVVDYLQRMKGDESDRRWEVSALSGELRALSRPCDDFPGAGVLALSSTARTNYSGGKKSSLRGFWPLWRAASEDPDSLVGLGKETGEIEYDASLVLVLTCDPKDDDDPPPDDDKEVGDSRNQADAGKMPGLRRGALAAAKVREGETGTVRLDFDGPRGCWGDARSLRRWRAKVKQGDGAGGKARRGDDAAGGVRRSGQAGDRLDV